MATEIEIDTIINTDRSEKGLGELRKGLKELISLQSQVGAGSAQFKKLQNAINETEGKIGDLTDSFQTLKGSGVERLNNSLGLLREGFTSADPGKIKTAFQGLGAAMSAIPIFLLIEGFKLLIDNFDKVIELYNDFVGVEKDDAEAQKKVNDERERANQQLDKIIKNSQGYIDRSIELAKVQEKIKNLELDREKNSEEIFNLKKQEYDLEIQSINVVLASKEGLISTEEELTLRTQKYRLEQEKQRAGAEREIELEKERQRLQDERLKREEEFVKKFLADQDAKEKSLLDELASFKAFNEAKDVEIANKAAKEAERLKKEKEDKEQLEQEIADESAARDAALEKIKQDNAKRTSDEKKKLSDEQAKASLQAETNFIEASQSLTAAYFNTRLASAKAGSAEELKLRKQQFNVDKAFSLVRAGIDGVRSVQAALTIAPPAGYILAAANGVLAAANIAKIASTKFNAGTTSSAAAPTFSTPTTSGSGGGNFNQPQTPSQQSINPTGLANAQTSQRREVNRVYVLESDIRNTTNRVNVIESRATF